MLVKLRGKAEEIGLRRRQKPEIAGPFKTCLGNLFTAVGKGEIIGEFKQRRAELLH